MAESEGQYADAIIERAAQLKKETDRQAAIRAAIRANQRRVQPYADALSAEAERICAEVAESRRLREELRKEEEEKNKAMEREDKEKKKEEAD